jgi:stage II sporulation protein D
VAKPGALRSITLAVALAGSLTSSSRANAQEGVAYLAIDLTSGATVSAENPARLDKPLLPGSVMKVATIAAALESGVISDRTTVACNRVVMLAGHRLTCTHPDLLRPLGAAEALSHSCNVFAATSAARLSRAALDRTLMDLGLPPSDADRPLPIVALGLEGVGVTPRRLIEMIARVAKEPSMLPWRASTLAVIRAGLHGAARTGTAAAFADHGVDALAKTGTTIANGVAQGLVVGVTPASNPTRGFALMVAGGAGHHAAVLAAGRLTAGSTQTNLRIGVPGQDGGYTLRSMSLEAYVAGVVTGEAAPETSAAALEALAITVRTFALANRDRHAVDGFDLCTLTHCQVLRQATGDATAAAAATAGTVLARNGQPAEVFYTASCGGRTERPSRVWPGAVDVAHLPSAPDEACAGQPAWRADLTAREVMTALRAAGFTGDLLRGLSVVSRSPSGRVAQLSLDGYVPHDISGEAFRSAVGRTLGWQHLKSTAFSISSTPTGFRFSGRGSGHGVGLCVMGAAARATRGHSSRDILSHYFPGLTISTAPTSAPQQATVPTSPRVVIVLPEQERGEEVMVRRLATRALESLIRELAVAAPAPIVFTFHPTVESYQRATGRPWFTTATTIDHTIHFIPLSALRSRRMLDRTIGHELVHVLTTSELANRPLWISEGVAAYFAVRPEARPGGDAIVAGGGEQHCPSDAELQRPASRAAMGRAYQLAAACVATAMSSASSWRAIRD